MVTLNGAAVATVTAQAAGAPVKLISGFPFHNLNVKVELLLNTTWTDITKYVLVRDDVVISPFGRGNEASQMETASLTLTLKNTDGRFTPDNTSGAYYPYVQLNTQIRVSIADTSTTNVTYQGYRFWGEVSEWPPLWDPKAVDVYCQITASGIWRRLSQRTKTLGSPYTRFNNQLGPTFNLAAYWPMEDGTGSQYFATTTPSTAANMTIGGGTANPPTLASISQWPGSDALPTLNASEFDGVVSTSSSPTTNQFRFCVLVPAGGDTGRGLSGTPTVPAVIARMHTLGTVQTVDIGYGSPDAGGPLVIKGSNASGTVLFTGNSALSTWGRPMLVLVSLVQSGSNVLWTLNTLVAGGSGWNTTVSGSVPGTVSDVNGIIFNPGGTFSTVAVGQASVFYGNPPFSSTSDALNGWIGENAMNRFVRICGEEGIPAATIGSSATPMGPQADDTLANVLQEIETTDGGLLYETQNQFGIGYRSMASLQNQSVTATLNYAAQQVGQPLAPVNDDALVHNDITLTNSFDGYSVRVYLANGARSLQNPPNGVGTGYESSVTVNSTSHTQINNLGIQLLNNGTVATSRYPTITANMARTTVASLFNVIPSLRQGDYLQVTNMPAIGGAATQKQLVWGWTETINNRSWTLAFNTIPEAPWESSFNPGTSVTGTVPASPTTQSTGAGGTGTVTSAQIQEGAIIGQNIAQGAIQGGHVATATITATNIADATITGQQISVGGIGATNIANASITATQIANATITSTQISGSANITGTQIASATITGSNIASATISGANISNATISGSNLASGTITATNIANATITNTQISGSAGITAGQVAFTASQIGGVAFTAQSTAPSSPQSGDLWVDTSNGNRLNEYTTLAVTPVGTPSSPALTTSGTGTITVTGAWSGTQPRTAGNLLVAIVTAWGSTSSGATALHTGTTGWTKQFEDTTNATSKVAIWTKTAAGADAAPAFDSVIAGTSAQTRLECLLLELTTGASVAVTPGVSTGNTAHGGAVASLTPTSAGNVPSTGCLSVAAAVEGFTAAGTFTFTRSASWVNVANDGATSTFAHSSFDTLLNPASGSASSDVIGWGSSTITAACAAIAVFSPGIGWQPYKYGTNALADQAVTTGLIAPQAVTSTQIANNTITAAQIANATITGSQISASAGITGSQIAGGTITASNITSATITNTQIAGGTITGSNIGSGTITGANMTNATITNVQIANGTITTTQITNGTIVGADIASGTITGSNLVSGTVTATQIAASTITASLMAANSIAAGSIQAGAITAGKIAAGAIDGTTITGASIVADGAAGQVLIYSGSPANGNLVGSWSGANGTDTYGNTFLAGLAVNQGVITGIAIDSVTITNATLQGDVLNGSTIASPIITGGSLTEANVVFDSGGGNLLVYTSSTTLVTLNPALNQWTVPAGVTSVQVQVWGAGAGGDGGTTGQGGNGGSGGQYSSHMTYAVIPGQVISYNVGSGGVGNSTGNGHGDDGEDSYFDGVGGIFATGGNGDGTISTTHAGAGTTFHNAGGGGTGSASGGAGGGGSSGGTAAAGNNGANASSSTGALGGSAPTGGAAGGTGGSNAANGGNGSTPGGGGGGAGKGSSSGSLTKTYTPLYQGSYYGPDGSSPNALRSQATMYHGGETASGGSSNGNQYSIFGFNRTLIASDFSGYTITTTKLQLTNLHSWYNSGMTIIFDEYQGLPGTVPSTGPRGSHFATIANATTGEGETHNFTLSSSVGQRFVTSSTNGLGIGWDTYNDASYRFNLGFYGYFDPSATLLTLTGTNGTAGSFNGGNGADGQIKVTYTSGTVLEAAISPTSGTDGSSNAYAAGYTGPVSALQPASSPAAVETWHTLPLVNSWAATTDGLKHYKLLSTGEVWVSAAINSGTSSTICTLPVGYRPNNRTVYGSLGATTAPIANFFSQVDTSGVLSIGCSPTGIGTIVLNFRFPTDNQP